MKASSNPPAGAEVCAARAAAEATVAAGAMAHLLPEKNEDNLWLKREDDDPGNVRTWLGSRCMPEA
eukprot:5449341-Pyramimonas_sp.AAC.1